MRSNFFIRALRSMLAATACAACASFSAAEVWESGPALPDPTQGRLWAAGVNDAGTLFAVGGSPFDGAGNAVAHYLPPGATAWSTGASVEGPVVRQGAALDPFGRILVFGGVDGTNPEGDPGTTYVYDIIEGQWQGLANRNPAAPHDYFAHATDDAGRIYSIGGGPGASADPTQPNSAHVERYTAATDTWQVVAPLPVPLADATAANDGRGHILVFGGFDGHATVRRAAVLQYDVAADAWSDVAVPDMPAALTGMRAVRGADDRIYVLGGESGAIGAGTTQSSVYVLNVDTNTWSVGPDLATPRRNFAATLGDDDFIYSIGGMNDAGGTHLVEKLYTPPCPVITQAPLAQSTWRDTAAGFSVAATGGMPLTYQWRKDGVDLVDGTSATGSVISGATSAAVTISGPVEADAGVYDVVVTNACGAVTSAAAILTIGIPPLIPDQWTVDGIHPAWAQMSSYARGVSNGSIGGYATTPTVLPDGRTFNLDHPVVWDTANLIPVDVTPAGSVGGAIYDVEGDLLVGWFWHTWQCWGGTQYWTCAWKSAGFWTAPSFAFEEALHSSGPEYESLYGTDGQSMVGTMTRESGLNHYTTAHLWASPTAQRSLDFPGPSNTGAAVVDGEYQYGYAYSGSFHATMWRGTPDSHVDLHPVGYGSSLFSGAGDGQAVGTADSHAGLWISGAGAFIDLHPPGATASSAAAAHQGVQAGSVDSDAALWLGTAASHFSLGAFLPPDFSSSVAEDFETLPDGSMIVVGYGYNASTGRNEALVWRSGAAPPIPGDVDGDRDVDLSDLAALLAVFGACSGDAEYDPAADFDSNGCVDLADLAVLLVNFGV